MKNLYLAQKYWNLKLLILIQVSMNGIIAMYNIFNLRVCTQICYVLSMDNKTIKSIGLTQILKRKKCKR